MDAGARTPSFGRAVSDPRFSNGLPRLGSKQDCQDQQCAEEALNPEEFGDEHRPPNESESHICGIDKRPLLPLALTGSTSASATCIYYLHIPLWAELHGDATRASCIFIFGYILVLGGMAYTALADPGQYYPVPGEDPEHAELPKRSHKAWLYSFPIRRYDHYCRWLCNVIGLLNHRSFVIMCGGLLLITSCSSVVDLRLMFFAASKSAWTDCYVMVVHLCYGVTVIRLLGPIFWMHVGFVSRNELAYEWKENYHYVAFSEKQQAMMPVNDLSDDEFNDMFDHFEYDSSRNPYDKGIVSNCLTFWLTPRHEVESLGDF